MSIRVRPPRTIEPASESCVRSTAAAYNHVGNDYVTYADGDPSQLFGFGGPFGYSDERTWALIDARLTAHRATGADKIHFLDAGCGPGTWLRRAVVRAHSLGYSAIAARGFDISESQIRRARQFSADIVGLSGVSIAFEVGDFTQPLPELDGSVDLGLCLYTVLNHLPAECLPGVIAEMGRVVTGHFIATVRAIGSTPTIYVDTLESARHFRQDHEAGRLDVEMHNGLRISVGSHLFTADDLRALVAPHFDTEDLLGLDLFHSRFATDPRWNPTWWPAEDQIDRVLNGLEETYNRDPNFVDRAAHLLVVARRRLSAEKTDEREESKSETTDETRRRDGNGRRAYR